MSSRYITCYYIHIASDITILSGWFTKALYLSYRQFILTVPIASPASDNSVSTYVVGGSNSFDLAQTGDLNQASSWQIVYDQDLTSNQRGVGNTVGSQGNPIVQFGGLNDAVIVQVGSYQSVANIAQQGVAHTAISANLLH